MTITRRLGHLRILLAVLGFTTTLTLTTRSSASPAEMDWCDEVCTIASDCEQVCYTACSECPPFQTTCGDASGGLCQNTCDQVCDPNTDGGTSCVDNGGTSTTCSGYGVCESCGDGICNGGSEDPDTCSSDCGSPAEEENQQTIDDLIQDMDAVGGFDGTLLGASAGAEVFAAYGYSPAEIETLDFENEGEEELTCAEKQRRLDVVDKMIRSLTRQRRFFGGCALVLPLLCGPAYLVVSDALDNARDLRAQIQALPCTPLVE